jgi:hypothetical protein
MVIEPLKKLDLGDAWYAIPPDAFTPNPDGRSLTSNLSREIPGIHA